MTRRGRTRGVLLAAVLLGTVLAACGSSGSRPVADSTPTSSPGPIRPEGFSSAEIVIRRADGTVCRLCTYLARTSAEWQRGLMFVTDLDGRDGMLFQFPSANTNQFWMRDTVTPLTAVWFAPDGLFIDAIDMVPCPADAMDCPRYGPGKPATNVLELPQGTLAGLGIGAGSRLESVGATCEGSSSK